MELATRPWFSYLDLWHLPFFSRVGGSEAWLVFVLAVGWLLLIGLSAWLLRSGVPGSTPRTADESARAEVPRAAPAIARRRR